MVGQRPVEAGGKFCGASSKVTCPTQLEGTGTRLAMGVATELEEQEKYSEMGITLLQAEMPA